MQFIEEKTEGRLSLGAGTLYGALNTLQEKGWIQPLDGGGRKKEFAVTALGREAAERELARLRELAGIAADIMGGAEHEGKALPVFLGPDGGPGQVAEQNGGQRLPSGAY